MIDTLILDAFIDILRMFAILLFGLFIGIAIGASYWDRNRC